MHPHEDKATMRSHRRTAEQWRAIIGRFLRSGLQEKDFCKQEGLAESSFARWRRRVLAEDHLPDFVELRPPSTPPSADVRSFEACWTIEIDLPGGGCLRIRNAR